ncbi:MAG: NADH-quinone oxidoreductase subunit J [Deltaproteobacteria bacterium]|nr:NADH-quinone oxidoreductase subunit J [Deltaproteobacteria bacterium]
MIEIVLFYVGAVAAILGAAGVVLARTPLRGALWLIFTLCAVAVLYLLLEAPFVAAMQVLVYAGAIMVLFVFVIMLLNLGPEAGARPAYVSVAKASGLLACVYLGWRLVAALSGSGQKAVDGSVKNIGVLLVTDYLFAFEAVSVLLLVAVVGAVVLGLRRLS